jgi:hypothetical protein
MDFLLNSKICQLYPTRMSIPVHEHVISAEIHMINVMISIISPEKQLFPPCFTLSDVHFMI